MFAPNHPLRSLVTAMAIGNVALLPRPPGEGRGEGVSAAPSARDAEGDAIAATRSHDTSRLAWARRPSGASSCRATFNRDVVHASPDELPVIDIPSR